MPTQKAIGKMRREIRLSISGHLGALRKLPATLTLDYLKPHNKMRHRRHGVIGSLKSFG